MKRDEEMKEGLVHGGTGLRARGGDGGGGEVRTGEGRYEGEETFYDHTVR